MRRFPIVLVAVALGAASTVSAQQAGQNPQARAERARIQQQRPDFFAAALRGIELNAAQQQQIDALRTKYRPASRPGLRGAGPRGEGVRPAPGQRPERADTLRGRRGERAEGRAQRGDTAQMRQNREEMRARMEAQRQQMIAEVRTILTPAQRPQFEQNLQQLQQRFEQREERRPGRSDNRSQTRAS